MLRTGVPRSPASIARTSVVDDDGLAYHNHFDESTDPRPGGVGFAAGQIGPTWTASGYSRTNEPRGRNVW
jgi:hypothetical protein